MEEIGAVGHRVVHGGTYFSESVLVNDDVIAKLDEYALKVIERLDDNGWCALAVMKK